MPVVVLPTDARVQVDGRPILRRQGLVELTGKLHETRTVHAFKGTRACEWTVTLLETGTSPAVLDLEACPGVGADKASDGDGEPGFRGLPRLPFPPPSPPPLPRLFGAPK